jgi:hypothetical protein
MTPNTTERPVLTPEAFAALGGPNLVYVREIKAADVFANVPNEIRAQYDYAPDRLLYSVCRADGVRIAVLEDREEAYATALANHLAPVSVH